MTNNSIIIIIIIILFAFYLIYSQNSQQKYIKSFNKEKEVNVQHNLEKENIQNNLEKNVQNNLEKSNNLEGKYIDNIKEQDLNSLYDPLIYPQMRLSREVIEKYKEYFNKHGTYPQFNQLTQGIVDNPILNGLLIKDIDENEPFIDNIPNSIPLFRIKSSKNSNRFFYYIVDQRYQSKLELKIPLDNVKINGVKYNNSDFYGLPELYDGDIIENIAIYPNSKFKIMLYRQYVFP